MFQLHPYRPPGRHLQDKCHCVDVKSWLSSNRFKRQQKAPFRRRNVILTLHASSGTYMFYDMRFRILLSSASPVRECMKKNKEKLLRDQSVCCCNVRYSSFLILCKLEGFEGFFHHNFSSLCPNNLIWSKSREIFYYPPPPWNIHPVWMGLWTYQSDLASISGSPHFLSVLF